MNKPSANQIKLATELFYSAASDWYRRRGGSYSMPHHGAVEAGVKVILSAALAAGVQITQEARRA